MEALGAETLIYVGTPEGAQLVARQNSRSALKAGDEVRFRPVEADEAAELDAASAAGTLAAEWERA